MRDYERLKRLGFETGDQLAGRCSQFIAIAGQIPRGNIRITQRRIADLLHEASEIVTNN